MGDFLTVRECLDRLPIRMAERAFRRRVRQAGCCHEYRKQLFLTEANFTAFVENIKGGTMPLKLIKKGKIFHVTGTIDGRRIRESTGTASREHAEAYRRELERDIEDRVYKQGACWAEAMNCYVEKKGNGQKAFLTPLLDHFGPMRLKEITPGAGVHLRAGQVQGSRAQLNQAHVLQAHERRDEGWQQGRALPSCDL
jgi:hypothetical protein